MAVRLSFPNWIYFSIFFLKKQLIVYLHFYMNFLLYSTELYFYSCRWQWDLYWLLKPSNMTHFHFFFKIILVMIVLLYFHMHFRMSLQFLQKHTMTIPGTVQNMWINLGKIDALTVVNLLIYELCISLQFSRASLISLSMIWSF